MSKDNITIQSPITEEKTLASPITEERVPELTYCIWMKKSSGDELTISSLFGTGAGRGEYIRWFTDDVIYVGVRDAGAAANNEIYDAESFLDQWVLISVVYNGAEPLNEDRVN